MVDVSHKIGFYPGSFGPVTYGHLDIITRAGRLVDTLVVAVGQHHAKPGLLTVEERLRVLEEGLRSIREHTSCEIKLAKYSVLTVEVAKRAGTSVVICGRAYVGHPAGAATVTASNRWSTG